MRKLAITTGLAAGTAISAALLALGGGSSATASPAVESVPGIQLPVPVPVPVPDLPIPGLPTHG
jgi:hypothetical protein